MAAPSCLATHSPPHSRHHYLPFLGSSLPGDDDAFVLLVSGLGVGSGEVNPLLTEALVDFVTGNLGGEQDAAFSSSIAAVIVAGKALTLASETAADVDAKPHSLTAKERATAVAPLKQLDILLTELASSVPVYLLPGHGDPSPHFMPQQPFHRCLLPSAHTFSTFHPVSNPADITVAGVK